MSYWATHTLDFPKELWILTQFKKCNDVFRPVPTDDDRKRVEDLQSLIDKKECRKKVARFFCILSISKQHKKHKYSGSICLDVLVF